MQNTITARRISYNLVALIVVLVAVALLVGFAAGLTINKSASAPVNPAMGQSGSTVQIAPTQDLTAPGNPCFLVIVEPRDSKPIAC